MEKVLRIRTQYGNFRYKLPESSKLSAVIDLLRAELSKKNITVGDHPELDLVDNNHLTPLDASKSIKELRLENGDLLQLLAVLKKPEPIPESEMSIYDLPVIRPKVPPCSLHGPGQSCVRCMVASYIRIDREKGTSKCSAVQADERALAVFQYNLRTNLAFSVQRIGILYGQIREDKSVSFDLIYEPPQENSAESVILLPNKQEQRYVDIITSALGYQKVGCIFGQTSQDWEDPEFVFTAQQLLTVAEIHKDVPKEHPFVILSIGVRDGATAVEGFELTDQFYDLYERRYFLPPKDELFFQFKEPLWIEAKEEKEAEVEFFIVSTALQKHQGKLRCEFPVENRHTLQTNDFVKLLLEREPGKPLVQLVSDFHLLLFLGPSFGESDISALCEHVKSQTTLLEGHEFLLKTIAGLI